MKSDNGFRAGLRASNLGLRIFLASLIALSTMPAFAVVATDNSTTGTVPQVSNPGAAQQAQQAGSSQGGAQMAAMIMAAMMAAQCGPQNPAACMMAAMAAMQAGSLGGTKSGSQASAAQFASGGAGATPLSPIPTGTAGSGTTIDSRIQKELAGKGAIINADGTMTLPGGKTVPLDASMATPSGQASAGLSAAQIAAGQATLAEAQAKASKITSSDMGIGGGGGGGGGGETGGAPGGPSSAAGAAQKLAGTRKKPNLSGMSKNLGNDKIGVAADNIFDMVTRRYQEKEKGDTFLKH